jgi:hypothetical protein
MTAPKAPKKGVGPKSRITVGGTTVRLGTTKPSKRGAPPKGSR